MSEVGIGEFGGEERTRQALWKCLEGLVRINNPSRLQSARLARAIANALERGGSVDWMRTESVDLHPIEDEDGVAGVVIRGVATDEAHQGELVCLGYTNEEYRAFLAGIRIDEFEPPSLTNTEILVEFDKGEPAITVIYHPEE